MVTVIGARLAALYGRVKPDVELPVIIVTEDAPDEAVVAAIERAGGARVRFKSALGHAVGASLTQEAAQRVARVPGVRAIQYDEPIVSVRGLFGLGG